MTSIAAFDLRGVSLAAFLSCQSIVLSGLLFSTFPYERTSEIVDFAGSEVQPGDVGMSDEDATDSLVSRKAPTGTRSQRSRLCTCLCSPSLLVAESLCVSGSESRNVESRTSSSWMGSPRVTSGMVSDAKSSEGGGNEEGVKMDSFAVRPRRSI